MTAEANTIRVNVRFNADDDELIRQAAEAMGLPASQFVANAATDRAREVLADKPCFMVDEHSTKPPSRARG